MKRIVLLLAALAAALASSAALLTPVALAASGPTVTTGAASAVSPTTATVSGTVNLNGAMLASGLTSGCEFEYGTTTTLSSSSSTANCATSPAATGTSTVTAALTGLTAGTTYYYQLAINTGGVPVLGLEATETDGTPMMSFTTPTAATPPTAVVTAPSAVTGSGATLNGTVNPNNWSITSCSFSYTPSGGTATTAKCATLPSGATAQTVSAAITGLTQGQSYTYTLTIGYGSGAAAATITSASPASFTTPAASVTAPTNLAATTATLTGSVNPEGQTVTSCTFYYGTSGPTLQTAPCAQAAGAISGTAAIPVSANVTGLSAKTSYLDTVVLVTSGGSTAAPVIDFTTPAAPAAPTATTTAATAITATTATLHATVNAQGQGVRACEFEYGVNPLTASSVPGDDTGYTQLCSATASDSGNQTVSLTLKGLAPKTTYYYRVLFETYGGYVIATARSFTTAAAKSTARPTLRISSVSIDAKTGTAKFKVVRSGSVMASRGYQCALVKGRTGTPKYTTCRSFKVYTKLKAGSYTFYVRGANANGDGTAVTHRFTI